MAKLGSDLRKPDFTNVITEKSMREKIWPLPASELLFVGPATTAKLNRFGVFTIGELAQKDSKFIKWLLGVNGLLVQQYARGVDNDPVTEIGHQREIKSVGNSVTTPRDLVTEDDIRVTTMVLAESVAERMREKHFRCSTVQVSIRYASLACLQRQAKLAFPSCTAQRIGDTAYKLILDNWTGDPLRSIGVRGCDLFDNQYPQLSLMPEMVREQRQEDIEYAMQDIRRRYGHFSIQRGIMLADRALGDVDARAPDSAHTVAFFKG